MKATIQNSGRGPVLSISTDDGRTASAFVATIASGPLATPMTNLANALDAVAGVLTANGQRFQPAALVEHNQAAVANVLAKPWRALQSAAQDQPRNLAAPRARHLTAYPETSTTAPHRA